MFRPESICRALSSAVERQGLNTLSGRGILSTTMSPHEVSITEERYEQLKGVLRKTKEAARQWIEALKEIKLSGRWKAEEDTWEAWCVKHAGITATAIRMVEYRERKKLLEVNPETPKAIVKAERVIARVSAKLDKEGPEPVMVAPQVIDARPVSPDVRVSIHRVTIALDKLLQNSLFAVSSEFRHCVAELHHLDKLLQPELFDFPAKHRSRGTLAEVIEFCVNRGLKKEDGQWFFDKCEGSGWKNNGKAIVDWRGTVRAWQGLGTIFPSQKQAGPVPGARLGPAEMMVRQKELDSAEKQLKSIRDSYTDNMSWSKTDIDRFKVVRARRDELKKILGIQV